MPHIINAAAAAIYGDTPQHGHSTPMISRNLLRHWQRLRQQQGTFRQHWRDVADVLKPETRPMLAETQDVAHSAGHPRHERIMDSTATLAMRTLASGLMGGLTSPVRPWFRLQPPLLGQEIPMAATWLADVAEAVQATFARGNVYQCLALAYEDLACFGTAALMLAEDAADGVRAYSLPVGSFCFEHSARHAPEVVFWRRHMAARTIVETYGAGKVSPQVAAAVAQGNHGHTFPVVQAVFPRALAGVITGVQSMAKGAMPYLSVHMEEHNGDMPPLRVAGFAELPLMLPRWAVSQPEVYGRSPGMEALGDIRQLQFQQMRKTQAIDKMVNPPLKADAALKGTQASLLPGGITYVDALQGQVGIEPLYTVNPRLTDMAQDIKDVQGRINRLFYADLFLMLTQAPHAAMTAREVEERREEKVLVLGPVLERLHHELLKPLVYRAVAILARTGRLPPMPAALATALPAAPLPQQNQPYQQASPSADMVRFLKACPIDFVSPLAQAHKNVGAANMEHLTQYVGQIGALQPDVLALFDGGQALRHMAERLGVDGRILRAAQPDPTAGSEA